MKNKKNLYIVIGIIVILAIIIIATPKKDRGEEFVDEPIHGEEMPSKQELKDMEAAPEIEVKEIVEPEVVAPGASLVTGEGEVLAKTGEVARNDAVPGTKEAPKPSQTLTEEQIPEEALVIKISKEAGFEPKQFRVKPGQVVTIALTSIDNSVHGFRFTDKMLTAVAVSVNPGETRAITFKAPEMLGEYPFHCTAPGHKRKGEIGSMIVAE
ncbi:cupredoxin domain-containing protein [bacterium]|nr:cupredoxin domain-containing protein [bacterium]